MKILKWNIDKDNGTFGCKINKAIPNRVISYETLYGEKVKVKATDVRNAPKFVVRFGHVIESIDLK